MVEKEYHLVFHMSLNFFLIFLIKILISNFTSFLMITYIFIKQVKLLKITEKLQWRNWVLELDGDSLKPYL